MPVVTLVCGLAALLIAGPPAAAETVLQADFNQGDMAPFHGGQYGQGEYLCEVVDGVGRDGTACARIVNTAPGAAAALVANFSYRRGHRYTMTFWARAEAGSAQVSCYLDVGDWRAKFAGGYSQAVQVGEEWQQLSFEQLHLQGRSYLLNIRNNTSAPTALLVDDITVAESEGAWAINWALADSGSEAGADSSYPDYLPHSLNDGIQSYAGTDFRRQAFATGEAPGPHWVQISFPAERAVSRVVVYWAQDKGELYAARSFQVQVPDGEQWRTVAEGGEPTATHFSISDFEQVQTTALRLLQPAGGGDAKRPDLLWIAEVEAY